VLEKICLLIYGWARNHGTLEGFMELVILGSGTGQPLVDRGSPSLALLLDERLVLFDMGPGTLQQLSRIGIHHEKINHIFISHFHPDHTAGLIHFLLATRHPPILEKRDPFMITGPRGLQDFFKKMQRTYGKWLTMPSDIMVVEALGTQKPEKREYKAFHTVSQPVRHTPQSLAYRVVFPSGKSFVYSGDTGPCSEIVDLARGTDLLILDCSFPDGEDVEGHLTPSQAGQIARSAGVNRLLLLHFYPEVLATDVAKQCRRTYAGELILGRDLLHLHL
jgi:ribonuclease BN (tRNA processing enzyme)